MAKLAVTVKKPKQLSELMAQQMEVAALLPAGPIEFEAEGGAELYLFSFMGKDELNWKHNIGKLLDLSYVVGVSFKYGNY